MIRRLVGIALICSTALSGCLTTTTQTCTSGPIVACGDPHTEQTWPDSSHSSESDDHTGAIIGVAALVTAVALTAVLIGRSHNDDEEKPAKHSAMTDEELRLERMYAQAHLHARSGRCDAVAAIGRKLQREEPSEYERFAADRELAVCLPDPALAVSFR